MTHTIARLSFTGESPSQIGVYNGKLVHPNGNMEKDVEYIVFLEQLSSGNYKVNHVRRKAVDTVSFLIIDNQIQITVHVDDGYYGKEMNVPYDLLDKFQFENLAQVLSEYKKIQSQLKKQVIKSYNKHVNTETSAYK